jgi:adenylate cyclase
VDYAAIGSVANLTARLCAEAGGGQILVSRHVFAAVEALVHAEPLGELSFIRIPSTYACVQCGRVKGDTDF